MNWYPSDERSNTVYTNESLIGDLSNASKMPVGKKWYEQRKRKTHVGIISCDDNKFAYQKSSHEGMAATIGSSGALERRTEFYSV